MRTMKEIFGYLLGGTPVCRIDSVLHVAFVGDAGVLTRKLGETRGECFPCHCGIDCERLVNRPYAP